MSRKRSTRPWSRRLACILLVEFAGRQSLRHLARLRLDKGDERDHPAIDERGKNTDDDEKPDQTWQGSPPRFSQSTTPSLTDCNNCPLSYKVRNIAAGL